MSNTLPNFKKIISTRPAKCHLCRRTIPTLVWKILEDYTYRGFGMQSPAWRSICLDCWPKYFEMRQKQLDNIRDAWAKEIGVIKDEDKKYAERMMKELQLAKEL